jgi:hypothetical protein
VNCAEETLTDSGSKWPKEQRRWSEIRESEPLDERIKENISARQMDHGQLIKRKNPPLDALEHLTGRKER